MWSEWQLLYVNIDSAETRKQYTLDSECHVEDGATYVFERLERELIKIHDR